MNTRRLITAVATFALVVSAASFASAATSNHSNKVRVKPHNLASTVQQATVSTTGSPPINGTATVAGLVDGGLGHGAVRGVAQFNAPKSTGTGTVFYANGAIRVSQSLTATATNPDGTINFTGTGHILSGTGAYKHIKQSTYTIAGSANTSTGRSTYQVRGTAKY